MVDIEGAEILHEAYDLITGPRQKQYAHPLEDYTKVCTIFYGLTGVDLTVQQALCFMLAVKLARLRTARERNSLHHDSLVDAIGYLGCMNMASKRAAQ